jgi:tripartite-type tricarboxylate transporter receptor subunit TctC
MRKLFLTVLATAAALTTAAWVPASAQDAYPSRTVRVIVPSAPGSTTDMLARLVADQLGGAWGKPVVVENMAGGAMNIGSEHVARAAPDGHTLMVAPPAPLAFSQLLYRNLNYDPAKWTVVAALVKVPNVLVVRKEHPASTVKELITYAKANPGKVNYASQGVGSTAHLSASQLELAAGIKMVHVPYRGAQPALTDVMGGQVDMFFDTIATSLPLHRGGKIKILGIASAERFAAATDLPTIAEQGYPGFRSVTWFGLVAPPGTPAAIADKINRDLAAGFEKADVKARLANLMLEVIGGTRADGVKFIGDEAALWGRVIKDNNIPMR